MKKDWIMEKTEMQKRFVYCNGEYSALEKEVLLDAAHVTASCGNGKISVHLADGITIERAEAPSETATLTIKEKTYKIIGTSSFEKMMLMWKNTPTIYVLDAEVNEWKKEWKRNKRRLEKLNISLLGIRELPNYPKAMAKKHESRSNATYSREYTSYQSHRQRNLSETNEVFTELSEVTACDKKKTTPDITKRNMDISSNCIVCGNNRIIGTKCPKCGFDFTKEEMAFIFQLNDTEQPFLQLPRIKKQGC